MTGETRQAGYQQQRFRVDLGGVIALLSKNLYSSPGAYIRELIQNAMNAVVARDALGGSPARRIVDVSPYGVASPNSPADEFALIDAGIGVSPDEVEGFLATVGASSEREGLTRTRRSYIGQFGIGRLRRRVSHHRGFNPGGRLVINAGHALDQEVLLTLPQVMSGVTVTRVCPASEVAALTPSPAEAFGEVLALEQRATQALAASGCDVVARRFPSADLPAVFIGRGQIDTASPGYGDIAHLVVNWDNRVVRALSRTTDDLVFSRIFQLLFVQARMAGQHDGPKDRALLSEALDDIILLAIGVDGTEVSR